MLQDQLASPWAALLPYTHTCTHAHTICCHYRACPRFQMLWHPSLQPHVPVFSQRPSTRPLRPHIQVPCDEAPCSSLVPTSLPSPHLCRSWPPPISQGCRAVSVHAPPKHSLFAAHRLMCPSHRTPSPCVAEAAGPWAGGSVEVWCWHWTGRLAGRRAASWSSHVLPGAKRCRGSLHPHFGELRAQLWSTCVWHC